MKKVLTIILSLQLVFLLAGCTTESTPDIPTPDEIDCEVTPNHEDCETNPDPDPETNYYYCIDLDEECLTLVEGFIDSMTLRQKAGQMVQAERGDISPAEVKSYGVGSILSGGGSHPTSFDNTPLQWYNMYVDYQTKAIESGTGIPIIYGIDAVHGNNNLYGATIFPHNIGLGAANDPELMYEIGRVTAEEMLVTGINWNFAPAMSVVQDIRWGRTYEGFSEDPVLHGDLIASIILGMEENGVSATAKHFLGDGGTSGGHDRGNTMGTEEMIRELYLAPYYDAIEANVDTVMISYSSINGSKMHQNGYWINDVLKDELGFEGFVISDWEAIHELSGDLETQIVLSVNAGVDMLMEPNAWRETISGIESAVSSNRITTERIDDAIRRILTVKYYRGLFEDPFAKLDDSYLGNEDHLAVAREAVRKSLVLLKNDNSSLPLAKTHKIYITGPGANSIGLQSGGWSTHWQGAYSNFWSWDFEMIPNDQLGSGIGIEDALSEALGGFSGEIVNSPELADTIIIVLSENPYAEGFGDNYDMTLTTGNAHSENEAALQIAAQYNDSKNVVGILLSGRPLLLEDNLQNFDSFIAAWLPGSEGGHGISDVLFGEFDFTGTLSFTWPNNYEQIGYNMNDDLYDPSSVLFPYGFGLSYQD